MTFRPYPTHSGSVLLSVAIIFGAATVYLINVLTQQSDLLVGFRFFVGLLLTLSLTLVVLYWLAIAIKLRYHLNRNGLVIQWGLTQHRIPFEHIQAIIPGRDLSGPAQFWGVNIAGLRLGWGRLVEYGPIRFHATAPLADSLLVVTAEETYLISPVQPDRFMQAWQTRQQLGPTQQWSIGVRRSWPLNAPLLADPLAWGLLGMAGFFWLALLGYLAFTYSELPTALPVHFNALGRANRIADKTTLLTLPAAGAIVLVANALLGEVIYRRERIAAYLLWGSTIVMQLCLWVALLTLTG